MARKPRKQSHRPSTTELEKLLDNEEEEAIEILPNGEVRALGKMSDRERGNRKPLTYRENLGGEYNDGNGRYARGQEEPQ